MSNKTAEVIEPEQKVVPMAEVEAAARAQGWSPEKGELGALEFLGKGREFRDRLYKKVEKVEQENARLYDLTAGFISKQERKEQEQQASTVKEQIAKAVEEGDADKVIQLTEKLATPTVNPDVAYVNTWIADHDWYSKDTDMQADAMGFYQAEVMRLERIHGKGQGDRPKEILPKVEERIKKLYPNYFKEPENPNADLEAGAEKGGRQKPGRKAGLTESDLDDDEKRHFEDFVRMGMERGLKREVVVSKLLKSIEKRRHG